MRRKKVNADLYPRTYRPSGLWFYFLLVCGAIVGGGGLAGTWFLATLLPKLPNPRGGLWIVALTLAFAVLGIYLVASLFRSKVVLGIDAIEVHELTPMKSLRRKEVRGWTISPTWRGPLCLVITPVDKKRRELLIPMIFNTDAAFFEWRQGL